MKDDTSSAVPTETRRLAAIMFTDIVGFSRQMGSNEARTLRLLETHNQIIRQAVAAHHGTVIKTVGDAFLVDFPSVVNAVQGAQQIQAQFQTHNADAIPPEQIHVRIGIHLGDIVQKDGDVFGEGVNLASRLQGLAEPDSICLSQGVYQEVEKKLALGTVVSLGQPKLKNIDQRLSVYLLVPEHTGRVRQTLRVRAGQLIGRMRTVNRSAVALWLSAGAVIAVGYFFLPLPTPQHPPPNTQAAPAALPLPDKPSIVVLPFVNMSEDPKQDYFSDGMTEDLTTALSQIASLFVIARNSAFTYKGKAIKVQEVGKELGVQYVLEGSVRRADNQVRITAQLVDAATDSHLWAERYDRPLQDIFALQDEIVQKIVTTLKLQLSLREQGYLVRKRTANLEAYDCWLRGMELYNRASRETHAQAQQLFEKAIALDPQYAEAYASLSRLFMSTWLFQWSQDPRTQERGFVFAQQAVALDDSLPEAHTVLAYTYLYQSQHEQAIAAAKRAIALGPNEAEGTALLGLILNFAGRPEEAIGLIQKGIRLNPRYQYNYLSWLGMAYGLARRYEEAIGTLQSATSRNPNFLFPHLHLVVSYSALGRDTEAQAEVAELLRISPKLSLKGLRRILVFQNPSDLERYLAALRKAGLQ